MSDTDSTGSTSRFRAELKGMESYDLPGLDDEPSDPRNCRIQTTIRVGEVGHEGADNFMLFFVTPAWLADNTDLGDRVLRYTVVMPEFTWQAAERAARSLTEGVEAESWEEFVGVLSQSAYWEYASNDAPPPYWP